MHYLNHNYVPCPVEQGRMKHRLCCAVCPEFGSCKVIAQHERLLNKEREGLTRKGQPSLFPFLQGGVR
jgi:hypothetical protein